MRFNRLATAAVAAVLMTPIPAVAQTDGWRTIIYPVHGYVPVFGADVRLPGLPDPGGGPDIIPSAKTSGNFDGAALAGVRVERARLSVEGEFLWAGMSGSVDNPFFDLTVDTITFRLLGGFQVAPALYVDAGVRYFALDMTASILNFDSVTWKPGIWEPVVGTTFRPQFNSKLRLFTQADFGWTGDSRSVNVKGSLEWKPLSHLLLGGGWGWMYMRVDGTIRARDVHLSQTLNGPMLSLGIPF